MRQNERPSLVLIQSRLGSSRLPGKALLPIHGYPLAVLAALRAANTGKDVSLLTSIDDSDDALCDTFREHGLAFYRGSLNNVLERFHAFLSGQNDDTLVFRLTADNVLPDGALLDEMERAFLRSDAEILSCVPEISNMPYGVSAELTTVKSIRQAYAGAADDFDREHVTPYIYRNSKSEKFISQNVRGHRNLRVTIDTFDDYTSVHSLFSGISDVVNAPAQSIIKNFEKMKYRPNCDPAEKPMTLGTAQFGSKYGITNRRGRVDTNEATDIIRRSITDGVVYLDTAAAYGESERVIGRALQGGWASRVKIITKLALQEPGCSESCQEGYKRLAVRNSVLNSCVNLRCSSIDTLMLHRAVHLSDAAIVDELIGLKDEGVIDHIGVSVQSPKELKYSLQCDFVSIIQMPFNILDYRWDGLVEDIEQVKKQRSLIIHARSALLQGLLCSKDGGDWAKAGIENYEEVTNWLDETCRELNKKSVSDLCIGYVNSQSWIDSVVVGIDSKDHLYDSLQSIAMPLLDGEALQYIRRTRPVLDEARLDPSNWS
ncbi:aldo/keto reductase [Marinovum sp.]|uniref:aldo/keto reductase n=1 Tax=Marinovum sp. TaxID=2024839 RepID=UPI003A8E4B58